MTKAHSPTVSSAPEVETRGSVPDGWKLVPREPTQAMWDAWAKADYQLIDQWQAMYDAAPAPTDTAAQEKERRLGDDLGWTPKGG